MLNKFLLTCLFIGIVIGSKAQSPNSSQNQKDVIQSVLEKNAKRFLKGKNINSVSIGIVKDGETYTGHFGELTKGLNNTPTDQTLYEVGSVSKTITGYLVAKAVLDKKIDLEEDIRKYLPSDYPNLEFAGQPVTVRHLLTHTSGLPLFIPVAMNGLYESLKSDVPEKFLALEKEASKDSFFKELKNIKLENKPGTNYIYSNAGAEIIGHILEKAYTKPFEQILKEELTTAYAMNNTVIRMNEEQKEGLVQGYWLDNDNPAPNQLNSLWATGSGMKMTMQDMMTYASLQLDEENPIVKESHRLLSGENVGTKTSYFWRVRQDKFGTSFNHHGGTSGVQNWLFIVPDYGLAVSIITNQSGSRTPGLLGRTAKSILNDLLKG